MKRVLVYGLSANIYGGIESFLFSHSKEMKDVTFDYVIEGKNSFHEEIIRNNGGEVYYISPKKTVFKNLSEWKKLLKKYKTISDTIYFNMYSLAWSMPIMMALKLGYKVFVHSHNSNLHDCSLLQKLLHAYYRKRLEKKNIIRLTNSSLSSRFFFGTKAKDSKLIYNGIDTQKFSFSKEKRASIRKELGVLDDEHIYGFSGRISDEKNPLFLIDIFSQIRKLDCKSRFVVCGDGYLLGECKDRAKLLNLDISFVGLVKNIEDYYSAFDVFVLPSRFEGLGIVLVEAQSSGLRCLTSDVVVPMMSNVTGNVVFIPLNNNPEVWAKKAVECIEKASNRTISNDIVKESNFNIKKSSQELQDCLLGIDNGKSLFTAGVVTFYGRNYGAFLQAYALQNYLRKRDIKSYLINYDYYHDKTILGVPKSIFKQNKKLFLKKILISIKNFKSTNSIKKTFSKSIAYHLYESKKYKSYDNLCKFPPRYDLYVSGSDQVLNPLVNPQGWESRLLKFTDSGIKITYAASSGSNVIPGENGLTDLKNELKNFYAISVREKGLSSYLESELNRDIYTHIDPVFLLSEREWLSFSNRRTLPKQKYIFVYYVGDRTSTLSRAIDLSIKKGLPLLFVNNYRTNAKHIKRKGIMSPEEWVAAIANAEYVVTNSFHATSFSLIFHKKVVIAKLTKGSERIKNLLLNSGLSNIYDSNMDTVEKISFDKFDEYISESNKSTDSYFDDVTRKVVSCEKQ